MKFLLTILFGAGVWFGQIAAPRPTRADAPDSPNGSADATGASPIGGEPVSFRREIAPILHKNCFACHGARDPKGGYQLLNYRLLQKPGDSGQPPIVSGKPDESQLLALICEADASLRMPQDSEPLAPAEIALIRRWIEQGAACDADDPDATLTSIMPRLPQPNPPERYRRPLPVAAMAFSPDGAELAVGGYHEVTIWNNQGALARRIGNVEQRVASLAYHPDGALLAVAGGTPGVSGEVKLFRPADGALVREFSGMSDTMLCVAIHSPSNRLAACGADRTIRIYDLASGDQLRVIEDHADWVQAIAWSPDGARLASASRDKTSKVFDAATGDAITTYSNHAEPVYGVAFSADGKRVFSGGADKKIHIWNPEDGQKLGEAGGYGREVLQLVAAGDKLFSASADKTARQYRGEGLTAFQTYGNHPDVIYAVAYCAATNQVATGGFGGEIRLLNAEDSAVLAMFIAAPGWIAGNQ